MIRMAVRLMLVLMGAMLVLPSVWAADDYKLGPGDIIKITVFDYPDLATEERVSESGSISFPLLEIGRAHV